LSRGNAAVRYQDVPDFVQLLRKSDAAPTTKLAFEFLILTAARTGEVIGARWDEINDAEWLWTIPPHRMKGKRQHVIPLSERCYEILSIAQPLRPTSQFIFSGQSSEKPLSNMTFLMLMRRMGFTAVPHGFRSSFRDWTSEQTNFPNEVCEMALAHAIRDKAEAAYRRGDLLGKRRRLMEDWSNYICNF
jgi:integrase